MREVLAHKRQDLHFVWIGLPFTILIGAGAWLGVPSMIIPMVLLIIAWLLFISYFWFMWPQCGRWRVVAQIFATLLCAGCAYLFYFVFAVDMHVLFLDGKAYGTLGEEVDVAVRLTNRGKATSLTDWHALLIDKYGHESIGEPLGPPSGVDSIGIEDAHHNVEYYAIPECDLRFQTIRALQTGDSDYGIATFLFRDYPGAPLPEGTKIKVEATDMLGRTVSSPAFSFTQINGEGPTLFPCQNVRPPLPQK